MLRQPPPLSTDALIACLQSEYALPIEACRYLPIGYDMNAWVFEAVTADTHSYFVKVRRGAPSVPSLLVPRLLQEHGIPNLLAPLRTTGQALWCPLGGYSIVVYPFVRGENAMTVGLTDDQWHAFGATLRAIHTGGFAAELETQIPGETFQISSASVVRTASAGISRTAFESPAAARLADFWRSRQPLINHLVERAEALGRNLQQRDFEYVLCHADIHAANILVGGQGAIYLVDWDGPLRAPRERDLLFVVGSRIARVVEPREEALFFEGYGAVEIDLTALAYYRYERVIEDIGEIAHRLLFTPGHTEEAIEEEAALLRSQFDPGNMVESALQADRV